MYSNLTTAVPITEAQIPQFYKDATFGVPAGDVASTESPEPGVTIVRDSQFGVPHIYGDTRAALDVRDRLRHRRGPAVLHRRAQALGPGRPRPVRRRRQRGHGRGRMGERALHAAGPGQPDQLRAASSSPDGPADLQRRHQLRRRHQRLHRQGREPAERAHDAAGGVRRDRPAPGPAAVHGRGSGLDRDARRRNLRQRRRPAALKRGPVRGHGAEVRARALRGGGLARAQLEPAKKKKPKKHKKKRRFWASLRTASVGPSTTSDGRRRHARAAHAVRNPPRRQGPARRRQAIRRQLRVRDVPQLRRPERPRGADDRPRQVVPVPDAAQAEQGGAEDDRAPRRGLGPVRQPGASPAPSRRARPARRRPGPGSGRGLGRRGRHGGQRRAGPAAVPALHVERAAGQRRRQRQRPSAGGDGPAGQLLHARRS